MELKKIKKESQEEAKKLKIGKNTSTKGEDVEEVI